MVGGILFKVNEEMIMQATGLSMEGRKWKRPSHLENSESLNRFFCGNEYQVKLESGHAREELPNQ